MKLSKLLLMGLLLSGLMMTSAGCNRNASQRVQIEMENGGLIIIELLPQYAPQTVRNFVNLVEEGFYDGLTFHRIMDGFMAQGGCPNGEGNGGSGTNIVGEFSANGRRGRELSHTRGVISMARGSYYNSASSQFFIVLGNSPHLNGDYAAFGRVIEGMDVVEAFQTVERTHNAGGELAQPVEPVVIKQMTIIRQ